MKLLIGTTKQRAFHAKDLAGALSKLGVGCKVVIDSDVYVGFPDHKVFHTRRRIHRLFDEFKPDAVMVTKQTHFGIATLDYKIPLLVQLRGDYWAEMEWFKKTTFRNPMKRYAPYLYNRMAARCFAESAMILPVSNYLKSIVEQRYPSKSAAIYQGVNMSVWDNRDDGGDGMSLKHPCVGLLQGADIWGKTREMLVLPKVMETLPDVTFYWAGDGPYRDMILPTLSKYDNFVWLGELDYPDAVRKYLAEIDVYVLASGMDTLPNTTKEAALMEKAVVATDVGGVSETMKDGVTGYLVERQNPHHMAEKISSILNDGPKSRMMGRMGRKFVKERFNWDNIANDFIRSVKPAISQTDQVF